MGQLVPLPPEAIRVAHSSPKGDDRKPYQASSFKNSSGRFMTSPFGWHATGARAEDRAAGEQALGQHRAAAGGSPIPPGDAPCELTQPGTPMIFSIEGLGPPFLRRKVVTDPFNHREQAASTGVPAVDPSGEIWRRTARPSRR